VADFFPQLTKFSGALPQISFRFPSFTIFLLQIGVQLRVFQRNCRLCGEQFEHREALRSEDPGCQVVLQVEHAGKLAGLIVDSASEVLKIASEDVEAPPVVFQEGGLNCVTGLGKVGGRLVVLLDMSKLLAPGSLQVKTETEKKTTPKADARSAAAR